MSATSKQVYTIILKNRLDSLAWRDRIHAINRIYEMLRRIHNKVGDVYMHRCTIQEFQTAHPIAWNRLQPILAPYVSGDYLTYLGWRNFLTVVFDGMHDAVCRYRAGVMAQLRTMKKADVNKLVQDGIIEILQQPDGDIIVDKKAVLRGAVSSYEFDPFEVV